MAVVDDFKARYPELVTQYTSDVVDDRIPILLTDVPLYFNRPYETEKNRPIILTLLAHLLVLDQSTGAAGGSAGGGVVMSRAAGSVSVSFAAKNDKSKLWDFFGGTKYGQAFIQMTSNIIGARWV